MTRAAATAGMSTAADIVIVGAGLAGAATAWHLARRRPRPHILIVEQEATPGAHSSGRNAAIIREHADVPGLQDPLTAGAAFIRSQTLAAFERRGLALVGLGDTPIARHFPRACGRGRWFPDDGTVDVAGLLHGYLAGHTVLYGTRILGWRPAGSGLVVDSTRGPLTCRCLVNAAGPWAGRLGRLPLTPTNRHLFVTPPLEWVDPQWCSVWDEREGLYFRPESGGLLLSGCDETPAEPGDYREDPMALEGLSEKLDRLQPGLGPLAVKATWVGQRVFAPDRRFVIGVDPDHERVVHVAGLGGHGVTASFAVGRLAAEIVIRGVAAECHPFSPRRFAAAGGRPLGFSPPER